MMINSKEDLDYSKLTTKEMISFSKEMNSSDIFDCIKNINNNSLEDFKNMSFNIKELSESVKNDLIKKFLTDKDIINDDILLNLILLIKSHNTLSPEFFSSKNVYVSSLDELLNMKINLMTEISKFKEYIVNIFFSMIKSLNKFKFSPLDSCIKMSDFDIELYDRLDMLTISSLISNIDYDVDFQNCPYLMDAEIYFVKLIADHIHTVNLIESFLNKVN